MTTQDAPRLRLARCLEASCPTRFRFGESRYCRWHGDDDGLAEAAERLGIELRGLVESAPGFAAAEASTPAGKPGGR